MSRATDSRNGNGRAAHDIHFGIAEAGKFAALAGDHREALRHYREALRMAVSAGSPEVFFRHYTQCVLESLELLGDYDAIIQFCENADAHYATLSQPNPLLAQDHGSVLERLGAVHLKAGRQPEAKDALTRALDTAGADRLPLAATLLGWLTRGLCPDVTRITETQKKHRYFTVRRDQVDKTRARPMPKGSGGTPTSVAGFNAAGVP